MDLVSTRLKVVPRVKSDTSYEEGQTSTDKLPTTYKGSMVGTSSELSSNTKTVKSMGVVVSKFEVGGASLSSRVSKHTKYDQT